MKKWVVAQAEWLVLGGYLLVTLMYILFEKGLLP